METVEIKMFPKPNVLELQIGNYFQWNQKLYISLKKNNKESET